MAKPAFRTFLPIKDSPSILFSAPLYFVLRRRAFALGAVIEGTADLILFFRRVGLAASATVTFLTRSMDFRIRSDERRVFSAAALN